MTAAALTRPAAQTSSSKSPKTKSTAPRLPRPKPVYKPRVRRVAGKPGCYTCQSQRWAFLLYEQDVNANTCDCEAGKRGFQGVKAHGGVCIHLAAARLVHAVFHPGWTPPPLPAVESLVERYQGAAGLLAAFGVE